MARIEDRASVHISTSDAVVNGLFNGLLGGIAMAAVIAVFSLLNGRGLDYLGNFAAGTPVLPLMGLVMHLAVSCIYGMFYALGRHWGKLNRLSWLPGWLAGLAYALGLWVFAVLILLPAAHSLILTMPWVVFFAGHAVYGLVLGSLQRP